MALNLPLGPKSLHYITLLFRINFPDYVIIFCTLQKIGFELFPLLCNLLRCYRAYHGGIGLHYIIVFELIYRLCNLFSETPKRQCNITRIYVLEGVGKGGNLWKIVSEKAFIGANSMTIKFGNFANFIVRNLLSFGRLLLFLHYRELVLN